MPVISLEFLSEERYLTLLEIIIGKIKRGYKDFNYQNMFSEFWNKSARKYKIYVTDKCSLTIDVSYFKTYSTSKRSLKMHVIMKKCYF